MRFDWSTVCFHDIMKDEKDLSDIIGCLQVVRIYSFNIWKKQNYTYMNYVYRLSFVKWAI